MCKMNKKDIRKYQFYLFKEMLNRFIVCDDEINEDTIKFLVDKNKNKNKNLKKKHFYNLDNYNYIEFLEAYSKNNKQVMKKIIDDELLTNELGWKRNCIFYYKDNRTFRYRKYDNKEIVKIICREMKKLIGRTN